MIEVLIYVTLYALVFALEIVPMIRTNDTKPLRVYLPIYFFALVVGLLTSLGVVFPSPSGLIRQVVSDIFGKTS